MTGSKCPIARCQGNGFACKFDFVRHWNEKHEAIVAKYTCPLCPKQNKRKGELIRHARIVHRLVLQPTQLEEVLQANKGYVDPSPFTLDMVLGYRYR